MTNGRAFKIKFKFKFKLKLLLSLVVGFSVCSARAGQIQELPEAKIIGQVGQCALIQAGPVRVLLLQGTPYQMGYAHGRLLAGDVQSTIMRVALVSQASDLTKKKAPGSTLAEIYRRTLPYVPARYREEVAGLADGAGINRGLAELANLFPEMFHCSGFALYGKATKDGKLIHGRLLDYMVGSGLQNYGIVIVCRPTGGNATIMGSYTGFVGCVTGMNERQIAIGEMGMGGYGDWDGMPMAYMFRQALEDCNSLDEVLNFFKRTTRTCQHVYVVSDGKIPGAAAIHSRTDSLEIAFAGHPLPQWPEAIADGAVISGGNRYTLLVKRIKENYGKIDVEKAIEMVKVPVAMPSNLHDAMMLPQDGVMYHANAGSILKGIDMQACYQTYYKYDLKKYVKILDDLAKQKPTVPAHIPLGSLKPPTTMPVKTR
jgi:isopenicillin-N N-acyltransferase like protein